MDFWHVHRLLCRGWAPGQVAGPALVRLVLLWLLLHLPGVAPAQAPTGEPRFPITGYTVHGARQLDPRDIEAALLPFTGAERGFADLQAARAALLALYERRGYRTVEVVLPPQDIHAGRIVLEVVESRIGQVTLTGAHQRSAANAALPAEALRVDALPDLALLNRSLQVANENPSKQSVVLLRPGAQAGTVDAELRVTDRAPLAFFVSLDNSGTKATGDYRLGIGLRHANLFDRDHVLTLQYVGAPHDADRPGRFRPWPNDRVTVVGASYRIPLYAQGGWLDFVAGYSSVDSGRVQNLFDVSGSGKQAGVRYTQVLDRIGNWSQRVSLGLDWRAFDSRVVPVGGGASLTPPVTLLPLSVAYAGSWADTDGRVLGVTAGLARNLPGIANGHSADFSAARAGADPRYLLARWSVSAGTPLPARTSARLVLRGQWTRDALVAGEQFGAGGADSVRGFDERGIAGDRGWAGTLELLSPDLAPALGQPDLKAQLLAFYDWAHVRRNMALPGETNREGIASAGVGVRLAHASGWSLRLDHGRVTNAGAGQPRGTGRTHFSLAWAF